MDAFEDAFDDIRFHQGEKCELCAHTEFGRGFAEPEEACACPTAGKTSTNGQVAATPDMDTLVRLVTDQVISALWAF